MLMAVVRWLKCFRCCQLTTVITTTVLLVIVMVMLSMVTEYPIEGFVGNTRLQIFGSEISCYRYDETSETLPDISDTFIPPDSIFFHETSCNSKIYGHIVLNARQACAIESAARLHPHRDIYVIFASPGLVKENDPILNALFTYKNVQLLHVNFARYINGTPLEHLYTNHAIEKSWYAGSHASDVLRYLTLWKYGGVYLDLDVVVQRALDELGTRNFAGSESATNVAAGVLGFAHDGLGHKWATLCMQDLSVRFSGTDWGNNGPGVITRLLRRLCHVRKAADMRQCSGFRVLTPNYFYPISWQNWLWYFNEMKSDWVLKMVKDSYAIHVWNRHSHATEARPQSAYARIARDFCPKIYETAVSLNQF